MCTGHRCGWTLPSRLPLDPSVASKVALTVQAANGYKTPEWYSIVGGPLLGAPNLFWVQETPH